MQEPTPPFLTIRSKIAVVLFVGCCLLSTLRILLNAPNPSKATDDVSKRSDQRFAAVKAHLPPYGVVGYIEESGDSATPDYYLAQYALAPLVIDNSPDHPLVLGNFPSARPYVVPQNLHLVQDFGNGVLLFASKDDK